MKFRSRYNTGDTRPVIKFAEQGRTKQSFKADCDINNILRKYNKTGQLPELIKLNPKYGDFTQALSYQESLDLVIHSQAQFAALPAAVRKRFGNDPYEFLAFASDPRNGEEMVKMGLATARMAEVPPVKDPEGSRTREAEGAKESPPAPPAPAPKK